MLVLSILAVPVTRAGADTASELAAARERVRTAQAEVNAAAAELSDAEGRFQQLAAEIDQAEVVIRATQERAAVLETVVRERAVSAYRQHGSLGLDAVLGAESPLDAARRAQLLDHANQTDNEVVQKLASMREDITAQKRALDQQRDEQARVKERLAARNAEVRAALSAANAARDELVVRLQKEEAEAARAELARLLAVQAARAQAAQAAASAQSNVSTTTPTGGAGPNTGAGQVITNPGGGAFQCPLGGSAYSNNYGPRGGGFHYGVDMFAPTGQALVAVKPGAVSYVPNGGAGGNEVYLAANDGNVYYYAHLSQFVGGPRTVAQGEVIGLVGSTGRSSGPHLHFEIRIGGANGERINPFSTLQGAGC